MPVRELLRLGVVRLIIRWGNPLLHRTAQPVTDFGSQLQRTLADMFATNTAADGAGLAAQQIGIDLAAFIYDCTDDTGTRRTGVVCNPEVEVPEHDRCLIDYPEGCLSLPGAYCDLARPVRATCRGQDQYGDPIEITAAGTLGRCLQHETDHINGIVFADRLSAKRRKHLIRHHQKLADRYPHEWPVTDQA